MKASLLLPAALSVFLCVSTSTAEEEIGLTELIDKWAVAETLTTYVCSCCTDETCNAHSGLSESQKDQLDGLEDAECDEARPDESRKTRRFSNSRAAALSERLSATGDETGKWSCQAETTEISATGAVISF